MGSSTSRTASFALKLSLYFGLPPVTMLAMVGKVTEVDYRKTPALAARVLEQAIDCICDDAPWGSLFD